MLLPRETIPGNKNFIATSDVYLEASHLCIKKNIAEKIFVADPVVLSVFYTINHHFMVAPASDELFRKIHKASQQILKSKNASGDKSISIQELLLDNDIDASNRNLLFVADETLHILTVTL